MEVELEVLMEKFVTKLSAIEGSLARLSESSSKAELAEGERTKLAELHERVAELESDEHRVAITREWARSMTPEAYLQLGQELGIDVTMTTEEPAAKVEEPPVKAEVVYQDPNDPEYEAVPALKLWVLSKKSAAVAEAEMAETKVRLEACFKRLTRVLGPADEGYDWAMDTYGGVRVIQVERGTGAQSTSFGNTRFPRSTFCDLVDFAVRAIEIARKTKS